MQTTPAENCNASFSALAIPINLFNILKSEVKFTFMKLINLKFQHLWILELKLL